MWLKQISINQESFNMITMYGLLKVCKFLQLYIYAQWLNSSQNSKLTITTWQWDELACSVVSILKIH